jgi:hypothetical protein
MDRNGYLWTSPVLISSCFDEKFFSDFLSLALVIRATRLGELSPFGWQFTMGSFSKFAKVFHTFGLLFPWLRLRISFVKKLLGYILDDFAQTYLVTLLVMRNTFVDNSNI